MFFKKRSDFGVFQESKVRRKKKSKNHRIRILGGSLCGAKNIEKDD
jgi:hypothetical protein